MNNIPRKRKILMIGNSHLVIFKFRKELVQRLVSEGFEVWVSFPNGPFGEGNNSSKEFGCNFIETHINRRGKNPFQEISLLFQYFSIIKKIKPDVVLAYTVKPDIYGGIVCRLLKVPFIPNITGLGKGLDEGGVTQKISVLLYRLSVRKAKCVFFQNDNDRDFFVKNHIKFEKDCLLPGSGVNLSEFIKLPYPTDDKIKFIFIARVMKAKGIEQFFDAAECIKKSYPNTEFHICGYCEEDYIEKIENYETSGIVIYHGLVGNVIDFVRTSHCIVLPTFHPEGISNVLLEGAACARPLITTNRAGCREVVDDGVSGFLVKERDSQDLIEKMLKFLQINIEEKKKMGEAGRRKIEKEFNREIVVESYMKEISNIV